MVVITANYREWRNIFKLRCAKTAHPDIRDIMLEILGEFHDKIPVIFDDIWKDAFA
jgi:thymidylate synthase (FAD)